MRIIFMGTPDFAIPSLALVAANHQLVAVVTQPDRAKGRGRQVSVSPIKEYALRELDVPILQPEKLNNPQVIAELEKFRPDCIVVVAYGQKIPTQVLEMAPYGCINVHGSLLPEYRGAAPIHRAICDGKTVTGVSTMYLSAQWDAGDVILQDKEVITATDTAGTLHDKLMIRGAKLLEETLRQIAEQRAPRKPQDHNKASYAYKLSKQEGLIDWHSEAGQIERLIRGMNPWPVAYTFYEGEQIRVWEAMLAENDLKGQPGQVIALDQQGITVATGNGGIILTKLQRANSRKMSGRQVANGLRLSGGDFFTTGPGTL